VVDPIGGVEWTDAGAEGMVVGGGGMGGVVAKFTLLCTGGVMLKRAAARLGIGGESADKLRRDARFSNVCAVNGGGNGIVEESGIGRADARRLGERGVMGGGGPADDCGVEGGCCAGDPRADNTVSNGDASVDERPSEAKSVTVDRATGGGVGGPGVVDPLVLANVLVGAVFSGRGLGDGRWNTRACTGARPSDSASLTSGVGRSGRSRSFSVRP
jgi:hypothetical protein